MTHAPVSSEIGGQTSDIHIRTIHSNQLNKKETNRNVCITNLRQSRWQCTRYGTHQQDLGDLRLSQVHTEFHVIVYNDFPAFIKRVCE